jgi:hypothetical protein
MAKNRPAAERILGCFRCHISNLRSDVDEHDFRGNFQIKDKDFPFWEHTVGDADFHVKHEGGP